MMKSARARRPEALETIVIENLPEEAVPPFEAAFLTICRSVALFLNEATDRWRIEAVRAVGEGEAELEGALALAALASGHPVPPRQILPTRSDGWVTQNLDSFAEIAIGEHVLVRPTHLPPKRVFGRIVLTLDAGIAFGSGEHASTQGCLMAFEAAARDGRRLRRLLDLGSGSGILAMAAAKRLRRPVLATDIEPWSVRVAALNAKHNGVGGLLRSVLADGWRARSVRAGRPYDLVFANILARPLCRMAYPLAMGLAPGGTAILAGLLRTQVRMVLAAHRRQGLVLERRLDIGAWSSLVLRRR
jgi:ribosomal protein L11 methyltransferase